MGEGGGGDPNVVGADQGARRLQRAKHRSKPPGDLGAVFVAGISGGASAAFTASMAVQSDSESTGPLIFRAAMSCPAEEAARGMQIRRTTSENDSSGDRLAAFNRS